MNSQWRIRVGPGDEAALQARAAAERAEYPQGTLIAAAASAAVLQALDAYEQEIDATVPWDGLDPPWLLALYAIGDTTGEVTSVVVERLRLHPEFWWQFGDDPVSVLAALPMHAGREPRWFANLRRSAGLDPRRPVIAWGFIAEAWLRTRGSRLADGRAKDKPELRADEVRALTAVDVDERVYQIQRTRHGTFARSVGVATARTFAERVDQARQVLHEPGLNPRVSEALMRLARLTANEVALRAAITS